MPQLLRQGIARAPWTAAGGPDPDFDDVQRRVTHALLTDPGLTRRFLRRHPHRPYAGYEDMIRALGYIWDCPLDGTANVTGFRCGGCGRAKG